MQSYHNLTEVVLASRISLGYTKCFISHICDNIMNLANQNAISISGNMFILPIICCVIVILVLYKISLLHTLDNLNDLVFYHNHQQHHKYLFNIQHLLTHDVYY